MMKIKVTFFNGGKMNHTGWGAQKVELFSMSRWSTKEQNAKKLIVEGDGIIVLFEK
jgi:hypothetical protein